MPKTDASLPSYAVLEQRLEAQRHALFCIQSVAALTREQILAAQNANDDPLVATVDEDTALRVRHALQLIEKAIEGVCAELEGEVCLQPPSCAESRAPENAPAATAEVLQ